MRRFNGYMHGIDIGGWLSQCDYSKEHLDNFITEEDIKRIKGWGCDHVRVPVDYKYLSGRKRLYRERLQLCSEVYRLVRK